MEVISEKTYNVMDGEPHLGKQIERIVRVDRDEYLEAIIGLFLEGNATSTNDSVIVVDDDFVIDYSLGDDLTQDDIDNLNLEIEQKLIDDDFGTQYSYDLIYSFLDENIRKNWEDEFETTTMRGY